jgi:hypothetical protein
VVSRLQLIKMLSYIEKIVVLQPKREKSLL